MVHQSQCLSFGLEAGNYLFGIHSRLDDFQGNLAADRLLLFGDVDNSHATLANLFPQLVAVNRQFRLHATVLSDRCRQVIGIQQAVMLRVSRQQGFNSMTLIDRPHKPRPDSFPAGVGGVSIAIEKTSSSVMGSSRMIQSVVESNLAIHFRVQEELG